MIAQRREKTRHHADLEFILPSKLCSSICCNRLDGGRSKSYDQDLKLVVQENTEMVDGIGGTTWDGSLVLLHTLIPVLVAASNSSDEVSILELGAGSGLLGLLAGISGCKSLITDREIDLIDYNIGRYALLSNGMKVTVPNNTTKVAAAQLNWGCDDELRDAFRIFKASNVDIVLGAEIACLYKQQDALVETLTSIADVNPMVVILLSFDGPPPSSGSTASKYEEALIKKLSARKFQYSVVNTSSVSWRRQEADKSEGTVLRTATLDDLTAHFNNGLQNLAWPRYLPPNERSKIKPWNEDRNTAPPLFDSKRECSDSLLPPHPPSSLVADAKSNDESVHHITLFYRPRAVRTCQRCHKQFFSSRAMNGGDDEDDVGCCRFHGGLYVCRKHPGETKLSLDGCGDSLGYYGDGSEGWDAEFWDCCASEDPQAAGCKIGPHISY